MPDLIIVSISGEVPISDTPTRKVKLEVISPVQGMLHGATQGLLVVMVKPRVPLRRRSLLSALRTVPSQEDRKAEKRLEAGHENPAEYEQGKNR